MSAIAKILFLSFLGSFPAASIADQDPDKAYRSFEERCLMMQKRMSAIRSSSDPAERERLMREHWAQGYGIGMMDRNFGRPTPGYSPQRYRHAPWVLSLPDLTADQRSQINRIQTETRARHMEIKAQLAAEKAKLRDLSAAKSPNASAIAASTRRANDLEAKLRDDSARAHERIEAILSREQRERVSRDKASLFWGEFQ